jgi:hypothetical protein
MATVSPMSAKADPAWIRSPDALSPTVGTNYRGFINRSAIEVGVWRFVEGGEHGGAIRDGGSTSLPSFRSRDGGEFTCCYNSLYGNKCSITMMRLAVSLCDRPYDSYLPQGLLHAGLIKAPSVGYMLVPERIQLRVLD